MQQPTKCDGGSSLPDTWCIRTIQCRIHHIFGGKTKC